MFSHISRRYPSDGKDRRPNSEEYSNFCTSEFGLWNKSQKIDLRDVSSDEFLGLILHATHITLSSTRKIVKIGKALLGVIQNLQTAILKKAPYETGHNYYASCPLRSATCSNIKISAGTANSSFVAREFLSQKTHSELFSKKELNWWIESLRIFHGRSIRCQEHHFVIQTDTSTKAWRHCVKYRNFHTREFGEISVFYALLGN